MRVRRKAFSPFSTAVLISAFGINPTPSKEQREAIAMLEDSHRIARQVYGASHPRCEDAEQTLESARKRLSAQEARLVEDASEKLAQGLRIDGDESDAP